MDWQNLQNPLEADETKRLFAAIFPSREVVAALGDAIGRMAEMFPPAAIRWTPPGQIHLTLNFLGAIETKRIVDIEAALELVSAQSPCHTLRVAGLGCFPSAKRARIVWAGLAGALEPLRGLKQSLDCALQKPGYVPETRPFHPHLTIGRVAEWRSSQSQLLQRKIRAFERTDFGQWRAQRLDLVQSALTPKGATYTVVKSFELTAV